MVEAYCSSCNAITAQEVANVLFGALPIGTCQQCYEANPLMEKLLWPFIPLLGKEVRDYQEQRASFEQRQEEY